LSGSLLFVTQEDITGDQYVCRRVDELPGYKAAAKRTHQLLEALRGLVP
jgi:hypothetical protein